MPKQLPPLSDADVKRMAFGLVTAVALRDAEGYNLLLDSLSGRDVGKLIFTLVLWASELIEEVSEYEDVDFEYCLKLLGQALLENQEAFEVARRELLYAEAEPPETPD